MNVIEIPVEELKEYENNPRKNEQAVDGVAESIKEFGFKQPIVIDKANVIVCGHTRLKAAKKLGYATVPCVIADDLNEEQIKAFRLADNKTAELAGWDFDILDEELEDIGDIDMSVFGFEDEENQSYIDELLENGLQSKSECETFEVTFCFPLEVEEEIKAYIKEKSKAAIVDAIVKMARGEISA